MDTEKRDIFIMLIFGTTLGILLICLGVVISWQTPFTPTPHPDYALSPAVRSLQKQVTALTTDHKLAVMRLSVETATTSTDLERRNEHVTKINASIDKLGTAINKMNERVTKLERAERVKVNAIWMNCTGGVCR